MDNSKNEKAPLLPPNGDGYANYSYPPHPGNGIPAARTQRSPSGRVMTADERHSITGVTHPISSLHFRSRLKSRSRHQSWASDPGSLLLAKGHEDPIESSGSYEADGVQKVALQKNLTLFHACIFVLVNVTGTGIFVTPTGVTAGVGSVGATLLMWALCGIYNLSLALCYAELGTAFPVAGGDYVYIQQTLGYLPAFMCLYIYVFMGPVAVAVASRTVGEYLLPVFGMECHTALLITLAVFLNSKY
jgi:amino acid permease